MTAVRDKFVKDNWSLASSVCKNTGIFPQVLLTQAIVETQRSVNGIFTPGQSNLAKNYNNYFGIVADNSWKGKTVILNDAGNNRSFRVYNSKEESFRDYVKFLQDNQRYSQAIRAKTPQEQIKLIAAAGYAENPNYGNTLLSVLNGIVPGSDVQTAGLNGGAIFAAVLLAALLTKAF